MGSEQCQADITNADARPLPDVRRARGTDTLSPTLVKKWIGGIATGKFTTDTELDVRLGGMCAAHALGHNRTDAVDIDRLEG